jgi:ATP-dependent RNA helicase RhlE
MPTSSMPTESQGGFASMGLLPALQVAASSLGFDHPTPIQTLAIPPVLSGRDLIGAAQTGSGKTAAFALPLLQRLQQPAAAPGGRVRALVMVPTRELAAQVAEVLRRLALALPWKTRVVLVAGGVSANPQRLALRGGADVVVATPGRLLDLTGSNALRLDRLETLVLDEADRLLDLGFADELQALLALMPPSRQQLLFSATFPPALDALMASLLHAPVRVEAPATPAQEPRILQRAMAVDEGRRTALLRHLLQTAGWERTLVFVATQYATEHVAWKLYKSGVFATPFHGGLSQGARRKVLHEFRDGQWDVVVTTDLAARGLDIAGLDAVVNYDLPRSPVDYVHRIGRTGRAGAEGTAVTLVTPADGAHWQLIQKRQSLSLPLEQIEGFAPESLPDASAPMASMAPPGTGGIKGKRPSKKDKLRAAAAMAAAALPDPQAG